MTINVTPIPKLTAFATPTITFGTAAAGVAPTVIRSDATIAGVGAQTSVDEAIARYNGTAGQLQGYTSLSPTISDAGIISLTSGALKFPATIIESSDSTTLDCYEEGSWDPIISDSSGNNATASGTAGVYTRIGNRVFINGHVGVSSLGSVSGVVRINGLPFTSNSTASTSSVINIGYGQNLNIAARDVPYGWINPNNNYVSLICWTAVDGTTQFTSTQWSADGLVAIGGFYYV
jgi:hypothetical protein